MAKEVILSGPGVIKLVAHYMSEEHVAFVQKALDYATEAHKDQFRNHPSYSSSRDFSGTTNGSSYSRHWFFT